MAIMGLCLTSALVLTSAPLVTESLVPPRPLSCPPTSLCVQLCCPPGQIYSGFGAGSNYDEYDDYESEYQLLEKPLCENYNGDIKAAYDPEFDSSFIPKNVDLIGKSEQFSCPVGAHPVSAKALFGPVKYTLSQSSQLNVLFLNGTKIETFNYEDFCVAFTENKEDQSTGGFQYDEPLKVTYTVCERGFEMEDADEVVYPVAIFISDFFVLVTLITYLLMSEYRTNMFGKITIGFLINVFFSYFFIGVHYSLDIEHNGDYYLYYSSRGCITLGYLIHHTLIAVFFWMSAMSIHVTRTMLNSFNENKSKNPNRMILVNMVYAQGLPFLITIVTLIMDTTGNPKTNTLPQIGKYSCWLDSEYHPGVSFQNTPEFLYFYLLVIFLLLVNIVCFILTGFSLFSHWWQMRGLAQGSINELFKTQLLTVTKLFFIMGIPWTFDVISAAVRHAHGESRSHSYTIRIVLDIFNLLTGVLIFISLICNKTVFAQLKSSISKLQYSRTNSSETQPSL